MAQIKNINEYIVTFLQGMEGHDIADVIQEWEGQANQTEFSKLIKKVQPKTTKEKKVKDRNKPKRGKSSYLFFCDDERAKIKEEGVITETKEVTRELGARWKALNASNKKKDMDLVASYVKKAGEAKEKYEEEMKSYEPPSDEELVKTSGKKQKKVKDPNEPKRPKNAFLFFCDEFRASTKAEMDAAGEDAKGAAVTSRLGEKWRVMAESDDKKTKKKYESFVKLAADAKAEYEAAKAEYEVNKGDVPVSEDEVDVDKPKTKKGKASVKKSSSGKDVKKKRGVDAFMKVKRPEVKEANPNMKAQEITKELARMWKELSDEEKAEWKQVAESE